MRLRFGRIFTEIISIKIGITDGFDYGRVWFPYLPNSLQILHALKEIHKKTE
ncbi:hypothetical protein [Tenacibaculum sediminilitoris]|uniref:hypothetical protein n=1 Tax=Tenacibaculum sediminilitoris TaxID=1820334 RepID=UPI0038B4C14D